MNGAESLLQTLVRSGVEVCFGNPRTSGMHFVAAPDRFEGIGPVWSFRRRDDRGRRWLWPKWRRSPRLRPGLMNGLASIHNARRASTPVINIVARRSSAFPIFAEPIVEFMKGAEQLILVGPSHSGGLQDSLSRPSIRGWTAALEALADAVKAPEVPLHLSVSRKPDVPNLASRSIRFGQIDRFVGLAKATHSMAGSNLHFSSETREAARNSWRCSRSARAEPPIARRIGGRIRLAVSGSTG
jgi:hypothetical protein